MNGLGEIECFTIRERSPCEDYQDPLEILSKVPSTKTTLLSTTDQGLLAAPEDDAVQRRIKGHKYGNGAVDDRLVKIHPDEIIPYTTVQALKATPCTNTILPHQHSYHQKAPLAVYLPIPKSIKHFPTSYIQCFLSRQSPWYPQSNDRCLISGTGVVNRKFLVILAVLTGPQCRLILTNLHRFESLVKGPLAASPGLISGTEFSTGDGAGLWSFPGTDGGQRRYGINAAELPAAIARDEPGETFCPVETAEI